MESVVDEEEEEDIVLAVREIEEIEEVEIEEVEIEKIEEEVNISIIMNIIVNLAFPLILFTAYY